MREAVVSIENASLDQPIVNWPRLQLVMATAGVDAVVASTPANVTYLSDFWSVSHWTRRSAQVFAIALRSNNRRIALVLPLGNADLVPTDGQRAPWRVATYGDLVISKDSIPEEDLDVEEKQLLQLARHGRSGIADSPVERLAITLLDLLGPSAAIALEGEGLVDGDHAALVERLPGWHITRAGSLLRETRAIKTPTEIARLRSAAELSANAFDLAVGATAESDTEIELEHRLLAAVVKGGGLPFLTSVTSGRRSAMPNGQATGRRLANGDLVRFDGGCRFGHYASDIARMAVVGSPTDKQRRYYGAVLAGLRAAIDAARPGTTGAEVFYAAVGAVRRSGISHYERTHCGHGIGIENYDLPRIAPDSSDVLEPGMVICLETPYYEIGWGGVQAEDTYLITAGGLDAFSRMPEQMWRVGRQKE